MSLNDLHLSSNILATIYPSSLVIMDQADAIPSPQPVQPVATKIRTESESAKTVDWKYLGNNQKNILVVVNYDNAVHLPDEELNFLTNMLTACKLNLGDVAIVNRYNYQELSYKDFLAEFKSKIVFLFGVEPSDFGLPVGFPYFQVQTVANSTFLYTPPLREQRTDSLLKSKLWVSLRNIFNI